MAHASAAQSQEKHFSTTTPCTAHKLDISRLRLDGPKVQVVPLEAEHLPALWAATMNNGESTAPNAQLFKLVYGRPCNSLDDFRTIICHGRITETHIPLTVKLLTTDVPLNFIVLQPPSSPSPPLIMPTTRFLEPRIQVEHQLEGLYLVLSHVFNELYYDTARVRQARQSDRYSTLHNQRSLQGSIRRPLLVREVHDTENELFVMRKEQWPALEAACIAWFGISQEEGREDGEGAQARFPGL